MVFWNVLIYICLTFITSISVFAQTINLEQARELALINSRSLARYEIAIRNSILDEKSQLYSMLPQVSAEYRASMYYLRNREFVNPIDTLQAGASLSITQIIFQGGKSFIQKAISEISTESIRKDALAEYFNVLDAVDSAYYAALEAQAAFEAEGQSLKASELGLSIAEIRKEGGMINQGDYLKALTEKEARENSYNQSRRNLSLSMIRFRNLTGITEDVKLAPVNFNAYEDMISLLASISDENADTLYEKFLLVAAASNPSLAKAIISNKRAEMSHSLSLRDYSPTISATIFSGDINFQNNSGLNTAGNGGITIRGSIPLDFWVLTNRMEKSKAALESAAIDYINAEKSLEMELLNTLSNIYLQAGNILSSRRTLEYTEIHFEFVMERYRLSLSSVSDLTEATSLLMSGRNNLNKATYSFLQSLSKLRSICAIDNEDELISILLGN